jgi:dihydroorotate dehydrogenase electron transfer subunit
MAVWQGTAPIVDRRDLAADYFLLTVDCPPIAAAAQPGQFANLLVAGRDLCLRRPISFYGVDGGRVSMMIGVHGAGTAWLRERAVGEPLDLLGPLGGRGLSLTPGARRVALIGGGVGIPPLHFLATRRPADGPEMLAFVGARSAERLLGLEAFTALGVRTIASTDDGSAGFHGTAVAALAEVLATESIDQILACGPTPMMRAAAELAAARGIACQVCLEARMACGVGACLSCVVETTTDGWRRYQRVCTEGPVFDGDQILWAGLSPLCAV